MGRFTRQNDYKMGYDEHFLGELVTPPRLSAKLKHDTVHTGAEKPYLLEHTGYSVALSASRRLAWFSSANLDAAQHQGIRRKNLQSQWKIEPEITPESVVTRPWYQASNKLLQRGHLTPADAMEWGADENEAIERANSTFFYSNAAPQMRRLNCAEWRVLEAYIGAEAAKGGHSRLSVHTGPVLAPDDPVYLPQPEADASLQIPRLFWKVVYYHNPANILCRVGFLMSQEHLLRESQLVSWPAAPRRAAAAGGPFADLGDQKTYQVKVALIGQLTGLKFTRAKEVYRDKRPRELVLMEIDLRERFTPRFQQGVALKDKGLLQFMIGLEL
ncbi:MAG: DNA/RNA non-specific endonuclease [Thermoanaerobaculia bacterium]|nr:DNA/RNA non-specific endonuclease [Thermoanaerobaculia bacterium]